VKSRINPRARTREDRAGDPLDGLVNLFDLGIVLAVAFLLAALSSINLEPTILQQNADPSQATNGQQVPADSVLAEPGDTANTIELQPGERVVGQGEPIGTVYQLEDGRTVIVRPEDAPPVPGEEDSGGATGGGSSTDGGSTGSGAAPDSGSSVAPSTGDDDASSAPGSEEPALPSVPPPSTGAP